MTLIGGSPECLRRGILHPSSFPFCMEGPYKERWQELCTHVAEEKDPARFTQLIEELLEELRKKDERLKQAAKGSST